MPEAVVDLKHNNPPAELRIGADLRAQLLHDHVALSRRAADLLAAEARMPVPIEDEDGASKVADYVKLLTACMKMADTTRVGVKEPYLDGGRIVDGFFKGITELLDKTKRRAVGEQTKYERAKADAERQRLAAAAAAARAEEERLRQEAAAREVEMVHETDLAAAIAAQDRADQAAADAVAAQKDASASNADLSRTRGDYGAVASLRTFWNFDEQSLDRGALDLETLRAHLPLDALQKAVRSFIKNGGRSLTGVRIFEDSVSVTR